LYYTYKLLHAIPLTVEVKKQKQNKQKERKKREEVSQLLGAISKGQKIKRLREFVS
jgi:hypothetical protein